MKGQKNRVYPNLDVGNEVKIFKKRKPNEKERVGNWSQNIYTIENVENKLGQNYYRVEGNKRQYLRFELLKVEGFEGKPISSIFSVGPAVGHITLPRIQSRRAHHLSTLPKYVTPCSPKQTSWPSVCTAQVSSPPAETAKTGPKSAGTSHRPNTLSPKQTSWPSVRTAQA